MSLKNKRAKLDELNEKLVYEHCIRIGVCTCLVNPIEEHAKLMGGDQEAAVKNIEAGLHRTAASIKIQAKDITGSNQDISEGVQRGVEQMLETVFRNVRKKLAPKAVH
jgi:hypothetical protein